MNLDTDFQTWLSGFRSHKKAAEACFNLLQQHRNKVEGEEPRKGKMYLAGPMTNLPAFNYPAFNAKAEQLRLRGYDVINPADHGNIEGATWGDYLRFDIANLTRCESIYLLPGWSNSKGARLEYHVALQLGMPMFFDPFAERTPNFGA